MFFFYQSDINKLDLTNLRSWCILHWSMCSRL